MPEAVLVGICEIIIGAVRARAAPSTWSRITPIIEYREANRRAWSLLRYLRRRF